MPLSINKLEKILSSRGLALKKFFTVDGYCVYLEVLSIANADSFMLYIPSKYEIILDKGNDVYKMNYIDIDETGTVPVEFAGEPDNFDLENQYDEVDINNVTENSKRDMVLQLEENYNHPISLKNINKNDTNILREIFRQLRRLKFCVQNIKYKLCIIYKNFICCIRRDDTFEGFAVHRLEGSEERKLMVTTDLETLYDKIESVSIDIKTVREGVYKVLDKNHTKHIKNIEKMLQRTTDITNVSEYTQKKKIYYIEYLYKLENLLSQLSQAEKKNIEKLLEIKKKYAGIKTIHNDIEKTHLISKHESELSRINTLKREIISNITMFKSKHEDLSLKFDNICFDNTVMIDAIIKNFISLSQL